MKVEKLNPDQWHMFSEHAHKAVFQKIKPAGTDRIDYALLCIDDNATVLAYVTVREHDHETVYWQFGGSLDSARGTLKSFRAYQAFVNFQKKATKRITTLVENTNTVMLKFAMKVGFKISGVRMFQGSVLVEHVLEFEGG